MTISISSSGSGSGANRSSLNGLMIAALDDSPEAVLLLRLILEAKGVHFFGFTEANSFLRFLGESRPDLVFLDIVMPETDGFEIFAKLRSDPETVDLPVVFLSSILEKDDEIPVDGQDERVAVVAKPFSNAGLVRRVEALLKKNA